MKDRTVKERVKNVLNYKKRAWGVSIAAVTIVVTASILLWGGRALSTTNNDNISESNAADNAASALNDTNTILPPNILVDGNKEPSLTPAKFQWPDSGYSKVKVTLLNSTEGYNWATEFDDPAIVGYIHASLTNDLIHSEESGYDNKRFNQYQIELYNDTGGYNCTLYHDMESSKAYVLKDGGLHEIWCEFARNIDCFLRDVNKGFGGKTVAAALFKQYGWTLGYDIIGWPDYLAETPCKLPSFSAMGSFTPNEYYFSYNNELSKDIGLDMSGYAGSEVSVRIYRLLERMPDEFYPIELCRGIVVWKDDKIIGAYISAGRHDAFSACSLNGYGFEAVTGQKVDEWLEKKVIADATEKELSQLQPEQIIERYFNALDNGDYYMAGRCMSRRTQMKHLTSNMPDNQLFNESVFLPLAGAEVGDEGSGVLSYNLSSTELVSIEPINESKFKVIVNLQYRDDFLANNGSGEQFWECCMVYESPQTGWKIVEFGH